MGVAWHILGAGEVSEAVALCLAKIEPFYCLQTPPVLNSATGCLALCVSSHICRLLGKGCQFFVPKLGVAGIS